MSGKQSPSKITGWVVWLIVAGIAAVASAGVQAPPEIPDLSALRVLDLKTAQRIALADSPSLAAARDRVNQAAEQVRQARSTYFPALDATTSARFVELSNNAREENLAFARLFDPEASVNRSEDIYGAGLIVSWTLFDGFARKFTNAIARYGERQSVAAEAETRRLLVSSVAESYFTAQLAWENVVIAVADEEFFQRQVTDAEARNRVGTGSLSDVLNFKVQVNSARSQRNRTEQVYEAARIGLAALMAVPESKLPRTLELEPLAEETGQDMTLPETTPQVDYAMEFRPDIRQVEWAVLQAEAGVGEARSAFYPVIQVSASLDGERTGNAHYGTDDFGNTVGLFMNYNLFSGGFDRARLAEARHRQREIESDLDSVNISAAAEVQQALTLLETAQKELLLQRTNAELVKKNRDLVEKEYQAGQTSLVRLNEAQRDLVQAQSRLATARVALRQAWVSLDTSTGRILEGF